MSEFGINKINHFTKLLIQDSARQEGKADRYTDLGLGVFLCWSICSVEEMNLSWPTIPERKLVTADKMAGRAESSVIFKVYGDVKEMGEPPEVIAESSVLRSGELLTWCFDVELSERLREVRLVVDDAGDGKNSDHANWVNAGFIK